MELVLDLLIWWVIVGVICAICCGITFIVSKINEIAADIFMIPVIISVIALLILTALIPLAIVVKVIQYFWNY